MNIMADTHTHTLASDHAYSTVLENISFAKRLGLSAIAITDHGPSLFNEIGLGHFYNMNRIPRIVDGICVLRGVEANIIDTEGNIDIENKNDGSLDWMIASFHFPPQKNYTEGDITKAYLGVAKNEIIDVIGHCGTESFTFDYETGIKAFKEYGKIVEINEGSRVSRPKSIKNCIEIARLCKKHGVMVVVNSDAHFAGEVGLVPQSLKMLEEIDFPKELILNADEARFFDFLKSTKNLDFVSELNHISISV